MVPPSENPSLDDDSVLTRVVTLALRNYDVATFDSVLVSSQRGVVTLSGSVPNWFSRSLAYQLAKRQPLATRVVDALSVKRAAQPSRAR